MAGNEISKYIFVHFDISSRNKIQVVNNFYYYYIKVTNLKSKYEVNFLFIILLILA